MYLIVKKVTTRYEIWQAFKFNNFGEQYTTERLPRIQGPLKIATGSDNCRFG
jgi:hypothetical protein